MPRPPKKPMHIWVQKPDELIKKLGLKEITSPFIFEPNTKRFHPEGLWSEEIFGPITSEKRVTTNAFIDLVIPVLNPFIYKKFIQIKKFYEGIILGTTYAKWDDKLKDFVPASPDDPEANTGLSFFKKYADKIVFDTKNASLKKKARIKVLEKYKDRWFMDKLIVAPAGFRDIREEEGYLTQDNINRAYLAILALAKALPKTSKDIKNTAIYDTILATIQQKIYEIYLYWEDYLDEKRGYIQDKVGTRRVTFGTRNVISSLVIKSNSRTDKNFVHVEETLLPLYQAIKMVQPFIIHSLYNMFKNNVFLETCKAAKVVDPKTKEPKLIDVTYKTADKYLNFNKLENILNAFKYHEFRYEPITIEEAGTKKSYPKALILRFKFRDSIYVVWDTSLTKIKKIVELLGIPEKYVEENIRYLTWYELLYVIAYTQYQDKYISVTRHPVIEDGSMYFSKPRIITTDPSYVVRIIFGISMIEEQSNKSSTLEPDNTIKGLELNKDLIKHETIKTSKNQFTKSFLEQLQVETIDKIHLTYMEFDNFPDVEKGKALDHEVPHITRWEGLGADADGDMVESIALWTKESNEEVKNYLNSPKDLLLPNLKFKYSLGSTNTNYIIKYLTW